MNGSRLGFTIIELLIIVVIVGILATIALPRFVSVRERAYFRAMISDLRKLGIEQELYYSRPDGYRYATSAALLGASFSDGVTIHIAGVTSEGWQATATHAALPATQSCGIYFGTPATYPPAFVSEAGVVRCTAD